MFLVPVFRDADVAARALTLLRHAYPTARLVIVSGGGAAVPGARSADRFDAEYVPSDDLDGIEHGGRMVHRPLDL